MTCTSVCPRTTDPNSAAARINSGSLRLVFLTLFVIIILYPLSSVLYSQTELGAEDDLTVLGVDGTARDPDAEIKGFTVFGSTQAAYTGGAAGPGNVVVNGYLSVSSGAYFVGNSTFSAAAGILINDGSEGEVLTKNGASGALRWRDPAALGDNLGDHTAAAALNLAGFPVVNVSSVQITGGGVSGAAPLLEIAGSTLTILNSGNVGIGTATPAEKLEVAGNIRLGGASASYRVTNMADPVANQDAATKAYVDAADPRKQFYITTTGWTGATALSACAAGYHMANMWEIFNVTSLKYNTALGYTTADSGSGPPSMVSGFMRTGGSSDTSASAGTANCAAWTSANSAHYGSVAMLTQGWSWGGFSPWMGTYPSCNLYNRVWCVEN